MVCCQHVSIIFNLLAASLGTIPSTFDVSKVDCSHESSLSPLGNWQGPVCSENVQSKTMQNWAKICHRSIWTLPELVFRYSNISSVLILRLVHRIEIHCRVPLMQLAMFNNIFGIILHGQRVIWKPPQSYSASSCPGL